MSKLTLIETVGELTHTYHIHINHVDKILDRINFVEEFAEEIGASEVAYEDAPKSIKYLIDGILEGKI